MFVSQEFRTKYFLGSCQRVFAEPCSSELTC